MRQMRVREGLTKDEDENKKDEEQDENEKEGEEMEGQDKNEGITGGGEGNEDEADKNEVKDELKMKM